MTKEALKLARTALGVQLDALFGKAGHLRNDDRRRYAENGIKAIDKALAQQALDRKAENARELGLDYEPEKTVCPFCTSEWVTAEQHDRNVDRVERKPLTDEEIKAIEDGIWKPEFFDDTERQANCEFARAIEAAHGIKGEA